MAGLLDLLINKYIAGQQYGGLQSALFGQAQPGDVDTQTPGGMRQGGLLNDPAQAQAFSQIDPRIGVPILNALLQQRVNPMAQAELQGKTLANTGADITNQGAAMNLVPQRVSNEAWLAASGLGPDGSPMAIPDQSGSAPTPQTADASGLPQLPTLPGAKALLAANGLDDTGRPIGQSQPLIGGAAQGSGVPLTRGSTGIGLPPGVPPSLSRILGPVGTAKAWEKFTGPQKLSGGEVSQVYDPTIGGMRTLASMPKMENGQQYDPSTNTISVVPGAAPSNTMLAKATAEGTQQGNVLTDAEIANKVKLRSQEETATQNAQIGTLRPINDPVVQSHVTNILNGNETEANVPGPLKNSVSLAMASQPKNAYSPLAATRFSNASNRITQNYITLPQYQLTANGLPYLQRIDAAMKSPGSVSDQDLLDSIAKLNTAGNAITDAQVKIITDGQSYKDAINVWTNKLKNGGVLSDNQRSQIQQIAKSVYGNYQKGYQPVYDQVKSQYDAAGIPQAFRTMPDLNTLASQGGLARSGQEQPDPLAGARDAIKRGAPRDAVIDRLRKAGVDPSGL